MQQQRANQPRHHRGQAALLAGILMLLGSTALWPQLADDHAAQVRADQQEVEIAEVPALPVTLPGDLGQARMFKPAIPPVGLLFVLSGQAGLTPRLEAGARSLARQGVLTVALDLAPMRQAPSCADLAGQLGRAATTIEQENGLSAQPPMLAGLDEGATLATALFLTPDGHGWRGLATVGGAPTAPTAPCASPPAGALPSAGHGWWRAGVYPGQLPPLARTAGATVLPIDARTTENAALAYLVLDAIVAEAGDHQNALGDLPLVELPAKGTSPYLAIIVSGDGGWRDIDQSIAGYLQAHGVAVVGLDALRYFWRQRSPAEVARAIERIMAHYEPSWHRDRVILVGFSFGADVLPATIDAMTQEARANLIEVSLLGLAPTAAFEIHMGGWLGLPPPHPTDVKAAVLPLDKGKLQCIYGRKDRISLCGSSLLAGAEQVETQGGHHFKGDYDELARIVLDGAIRRNHATPEPALADR